MTPTLSPGDHLLVDAQAYDDGLPAVGDIVVAQHPFADHIVMTKRVTACHNNQVWLGSDNLHVGADSRHFGPVAPALLRGRVTVCLGSQDTSADIPGRLEHSTLRLTT
jgi:nickel-type superoxide dismutase maturation protease